MEQRPARLFVCARCRAQVLLCSHCDRGNRYCGRGCRREARDAARREAGRRYQRSHRGRMAHAARSRRWRRRRAEAAHDVTHQGSQAEVRPAPLAACTEDHTSALPAPCDKAPDVTPSAALPSATPPITPPNWHCRRCAAPLPRWVRQGFLRRGRRDRAAPSLARWWRRDHLP
jgi:hypothetical protein